MTKESRYSRVPTESSLPQPIEKIAAAWPTLPRERRNIRELLWWADLQPNTLDTRYSEAFEPGVYSFTRVELPDLPLRLQQLRAYRTEQLLWARGTTNGN